jgi:hypothetical protein
VSFLSLTGANRSGVFFASMQKFRLYCKATRLRGIRLFEYRTSLASDRWSACSSLPSGQRLPRFRGFSEAGLSGNRAREIQGDKIPWMQALLTPR